MTSWKKPIFGVVAGVLLMTSAMASKGDQEIRDYIDTLPIENVDAAEEAQLIHMRQEEKLARDVYQVLDAAWSIRAFRNIAKSEQSHMDLIKYILDRYGLEDPLKSDQIGVYPDPAFAALFTKLVNVGLLSPFHAELVGAYIEDLDIFDLDLAMAQTDNRDMNTVWQNLQRGSRNHMRSFFKLLQKQDFLYTGIVLPTWRIADIVTTPREDLPVDENGVPLP